MRRLSVFIFIMLPLFVSADEPPPQIDATPEPPDLPMPVESGETLEPDITIIRRGEKTIQEYSVNGQIYMIKIIPDIGPAYYLIDKDGDGNMEVRGTDLDNGININQWQIYSWE
jgi:hypothetical protein